MEGDRLEAVRLQGSRLLDTAAIKIATCYPLAQDPVPGSSIRPGIKYPDVPLKLEYLDLLETTRGQHWLKEATDGTLRSLDGLERPVARPGVVGGTTVGWKLRLRGRSDEIPMELRLDSDENAVSAHWMVWPSFRAPRGTGWKTYYLYDYTGLRDAQLEAVWADEAGEQPTVRVSAVPHQHRGHELQAAACPVAFGESGGTMAHQGGPPLALSLKDKGNRDAGIYMVPLRQVGQYNAEIELGIDFGTSHSSAAVRTSGDETPRTVSLAPELDLPPNHRPLTVSISESWKAISESPAGIFGFHGWLPTYRSTGGGFLPSELLLINSLENVQAQDVREWIPGLDFLIPPTDMGREDLAKHILTDFKWDAGSEHFHGHEDHLRQHYLSLLLEMVLADVVVNHTNGIPKRQVNVTFTYPLRAKDKQVQALRDSFSAALVRTKASTGIDLRLFNDIGIYDESRAARVSTELEGEVILVADLGGATLDVFVAAKSAKDVVPEVADSARIGGNLFLRQIAEAPDGILPADGNWKSNGFRDTETKLRAWVRTLGAAQLFGTEAGERPTLKSMGVEGFRSASEGDPARRLIDRYFRLVTEYLARYLASYLYKHWYPKVPKKSWDRLKISVQLRGNGWKLRYTNDSHAATTREIQESIQARVRDLWKLLPDKPSYPNPSEAEWADPGQHAQQDPKTITVTGVVGKAMRYEEVKERWNSHTLVDLDVLHDAGDRSTFGWYETIPLETRNSKNVEVRTIQPPVIVSSPFDDHLVAIEALDDAHHGAVQTKLKQTESRLNPAKGTYIAPVAPIVWEAIFDSKAYWPKD